MASTTKRNSEALDAQSSSDIESVIAQAIALEKSAQSRQALAVLSTWLARIDIAECDELVYARQADRGLTVLEPPQRIKILRLPWS